MQIEFDPSKDEANRAKHGIPLTAAAAIDLDAAIVREDLRFLYGEPRFLAYASIEGRFHVLCFTMRGERVRVISLRRANDRERRRYERSG